MSRKSDKKRKSDNLPTTDDMLNKVETIKEEIDDLLGNYMFNKVETIKEETDDLLCKMTSKLNELLEKENDMDSTLAEKTSEYEDKYTRRANELEQAYDKKIQKLKKEQEKWELEKVKVSSTHSFESRIKLDVGGTQFTTTLTTLTRFPDSMIGAMFSGRHKLVADDSGYYFIDRDGTHFRHILNFLRCPEEFNETIEEDEKYKEIMREAAYYGLDIFMDQY